MGQRRYGWKKGCLLVHHLFCCIWHLCALCAEAAISRRSGLAATRHELDASVVGPLGVG
jgi:hypothetical protein